MSRSKNTSQTKRSQSAMSILGSVLSGRDGVVIVLFVLVALLLFTKLFSLTVVEAEELSTQGSQVRTTTIDLTARRGTIYDRNGNVLATSVDAVTIYANPSKVDDPHETSEILAEVLGGTKQHYYELITESQSPTFVYLAKKVDPEKEEAIKEANQVYISEEVDRIQARGDDVPAEIITPLTGIEFLKDTRREYPKGNTGAQVIGAVNDEGIGVSGLEQTYDSILRGVDGYRIIEQAKQVSQTSSPLPMIDSVVEEVDPVAGQDIIISIDIEIQQYLELNLQAVAAGRNCDDASSILLDGSSGEIIATASIPLYDRENVTSEEIENGATNAKAITQPYEPGSTFKPVIAGAALEQGIMTAESTVYCPQSLQIYDYSISDAYDRGDEEMSLRNIIGNSSNVGVSLVEQQVGDEVFYDYLTKMKLGEYTHVDYPAETSGTLAPVEEWTAVQAANIAFGQGLETSVLQMASIYGAIANDGERIQPHFLIARPQYDVALEYPSHRIYGAQTCRDLEEIVQTVVTEGYGARASIEGYDVVGKTGTAQQADENGGYEGTWGEFTVSFVGYIDNSTSNYVFMSSFDNPTNYSDNPAVPFFSNVMSFVVNRFMIEPEEEAPVLLDPEATTHEANESVDQGATTEGETPPAREGETSLSYPTPRAGADWQVDTSG